MTRDLLSAPPEYRRFVAAEFRRLGRPGAYRLGRLGAQGLKELQRPAVLQPRLARRRPGHVVPAPAWLAGLAAVIAVIAVTAAAGWWFVPLLAGLALAAANRPGGWPPMVALPAVAVAALAGAVLARPAGALLGTAHHVPLTTVPIALLTALIGYAVPGLLAMLRA